MDSVLCVLLVRPLLTTVLCLPIFTDATVSLLGLASLAFTDAILVGFRRSGREM